MTIDASTSGTGGTDDVRVDPPGTATDIETDTGTNTGIDTGIDTAAGSRASGAGTSASPVAARVPTVDVVRDVVAAVLLVAALALPWTFGSRSADHVDAVLSTVVALLAIPLPYLARAGALPSGWTVSTTRTVRLWAAAPFVVVSVVYLVIDLVNGSIVLSVHGIGTGLGLGLAGALLVAQPRRCELGPVEADTGSNKLWRVVLVVLTAVVAVGAVVALVLFFTSSNADITGSEVVLALCMTLVTFALGVLPAWGACRRDAAWATVLIGVGAALGVLFLVGSGGVRGLLTVESLHHLAFGLVLVPAQAAVVAGAVFMRSGRSSGEASPAVPADDAVAASDAESAGVEGPGSDTTDAPSVDASSAETSGVETAGASSGPVAAPVQVSRAVVVRTFLVLAATSALVAINAAVSMGIGARGSVVVVTLVATALIAVLTAFAWFRLRSGSAGLDGALLAAIVIACTAVVGTAAVAVDASDHAGVPLDLAMVAWGLPAFLVWILGSAAGRSWWSQSHDEAVGRTAAYEWAPRKPAAPRVALTPAAPAESKATSRADHRDAQRAEHSNAQREAEASAPMSAGSSAAAYGATQQGATTDRSAQDAPYTPAGARTSAVPVEPRPAADDAHETAIMEPVAAEAGFTGVQASDPSTPLEDLAKIAEHAPSLRPLVAANPSTYTALLDWLGALGDPDIDRALASRTDRRG